jgi:hypothetical protein
MGAFGRAVIRRWSGVIGGGDVIPISEAKGSPKRQKKKTRTQTIGKFNDVSSADENK